MPVPFNSKPSKKLNIFLDLDHTLICSEDYSMKSLRSALLHRDYDFIPPYITAARPHLQFFLDDLFENYNVGIWTAASKSYASFIVDRFIKKYNPNRKIDLLLYSIHCEMSTLRTGGSKSLSMLWSEWNLPGYNASNTYIIDDLKEVYTIQPNNCIRIKKFVTNNYEDDELLKTLNILKNL